MSTKWTKGELMRIVDERCSDAALEVLMYLCERGPRVVDWDNDCDVEREADEEIRRQLRDADEADGVP